MSKGKCCHTVNRVMGKKLHEEAIVPTRTGLSDAGWDLYSLEDVVICAGQRVVVKTGIALEIPEEFVGLIWPRSGLAVKQGISVLAGVIDSGYRGEIMVCLLNTNKEMPLSYSDIADVNINKGDRIAQILFQQVPDFQLIETMELFESVRGDKGFGSSGK